MKKAKITELFFVLDKGERLKAIFRLNGIRSESVSIHTVAEWAESLGISTKKVISLIK
jgi:hypothetical protein